MQIDGRADDRNFVTSLKGTRRHKEYSESGRFNVDISMQSGLTASCATRRALSPFTQFTCILRECSIRSIDISRVLQCLSRLTFEIASAGKEN